MMVPAFFFALALLIYGQSLLGNDFIHNFDDGLLITMNPAVQGITWDNLRYIFTHFDPELYIPLTFFSFQLNYLVGELHPFGYHLVNVLLHAANALLLTSIVRKLTGREWAAIVTGLLFLVHPLHTEAVAWAAGRKDLLSAFFLLLSYRVLLQSRGNDSIKQYWTSVGLFVLALLSKVMAVVLPVLIPLIDWARGEKITRQKIKELAPYFLLAIIFGAVASLGKLGGGSLLLEKFLIGCKAIVFFLQKLIVPTHLSILYPYTQPIGITTPDLLGSFIMVILITAVVLFLARRSRIPLVLWLFFLITLAPTFANIAKGMEQLRDVYVTTDRYAYLPSMSILFAAALLLDEARRRWKTVTNVVVLAALVALSALSYRQSLVWKNFETLFAHAASAYPNAHMAHTFMGTAKYERGDLAGALKHFSDSIAIRPNDFALFNTGLVYEKLGRTAEAIDAYQKTIAINPITLNARINLGVLYMNMNRYEEAVRLFQDAIDAAPIHAVATDVTPRLAILYFNLGEANEHLGKRDQAIAAYRKALELNPSDSEAAEKIRLLVVR